MRYRVCSAAMSDAMAAGVYARQSRGRTKSVDEQIEACTADVARACEGFAVGGIYTDLVSASRYGAKARHDYGKLLADIGAGKLRMIATWSPDRADRTLTTWSGFLDACRDHKVLIRVTDHERTYDVTNPRDWRSLAEDGIDAAYFSEKLSRAIIRGVGGAAKQGKPPMGPVPYGYRRTYDVATGKLQGQEPDPDTAPIVKEIFGRVVKGEAISRIIADLDGRGVEPPGRRSFKTGSQRWYPMRVRSIVLNPVYIGQRRHRATGQNASVRPEVFDASWPALVGETEFYAAGNVVNDPSRLINRRPGRQTHLLSYLATCFRGHPLVGRSHTSSHGRRVRTYAYSCLRGCAWVNRALLDELVEERVLTYLSRDDVYGRLRQLGEVNDKEVHDAYAEVARLRNDLDDWRLSAARGKTTPESLAVIEADLTRQIKDADRRAKQAGVPPALRALLTAEDDVAARWEQATLAAKRDVIRALLTVELHPAKKSSSVVLEDRVTITPKRPSADVR